MATTETRQQAESRGGRHGFASTYNRGCRCPECKRAKHEQYVRRKVRCASEPRALIGECADVIQATCNLLDAFGVVDMEQHMEECRARNEARGREYR